MNPISKLDLSSSFWKLSCHRPYTWMLRHGVNEPSNKDAEFTIRARVPGSNLTALREAETIPDWNVGLKSRDCEWLEHRHWEFFTDLQPFDAGSTLTLEPIRECGRDRWVLHHRRGHTEVAVLHHRPGYGDVVCVDVWKRRRLNVIDPAVGCR